MKFSRKTLTVAFVLIAAVLLTSCGQAQSASSNAPAQSANAGASANGHDRLVSAGEAQLDGTLSVSLFNSFIPQPGQCFTIVVASVVSGHFAATNLPALPDGVGLMLVRRGSRFMGFTPEGERVLSWARRIVADARAMRQEVDTLKRGKAA